jgi:hypothetical protein
VEKVAPLLVERLSGTHLSEFWGRAYCRMMDHTGIARLLYEDHLGGWHVTNPDRNYVPPVCSVCNESLWLVIQLECGTATNHYGPARLTPSRPISRSTNDRRSGVPVIAVTTLWASLMRSGTLRGSLRVTTARLIRFGVVMEPHWLGR